MRAAAQANTNGVFERINVESRPASGMGRSPSSGKRARYAYLDGLTGVKVAARMAEHQRATREVRLGDQGRQPDGQRHETR